MWKLLPSLDELRRKGQFEGERYIAWTSRDNHPCCSDSFVFDCIDRTDQAKGFGGVDMDKALQISVLWYHFLVFNKNKSFLFTFFRVRDSCEFHKPFTAHYIVCDAETDPRFLLIAYFTSTHHCAWQQNFFRLWISLKNEGTKQQNSAEMSHLNKHRCWSSL